MINCNEYYGSPISNQQNFGFIAIDTQEIQSTQPLTSSHKYWTCVVTRLHTESNYIKYSIFDASFLEYINMTNFATYETRVSERLKDDILTQLDVLFPEFPFEKFPELSLIRFEWDNATRLVLNYAPENIKLKLIKQLRDDFWNIYTKRINIHTSSIQEHELEDEKELIEVEQKIVDIRDEILSKYYVPSERSIKLAKAFINSRDYNFDK